MSAPDGRLALVAAAAGRLAEVGEVATVPQAHDAERVAGFLRGLTGRPGRRTAGATACPTWCTRHYGKGRNAAHSTTAAVVRRPGPAADEVEKYMFERFGEAPKFIDVSAFQVGDRADILLTIRGTATRLSPEEALAIAEGLARLAHAVPAADARRTRGHLTLAWDRTVDGARERAVQRFVGAVAQ